MVDLAKPCKVWDGAHRSCDGRPVRGRQYEYIRRWEERYGPVPPGHILHHECENSWCIEEDHLSPMTQSEHCRLHGFGQGDIHQRLKTHCSNGHPYDEENTYVAPNGWRYCRTCRINNKREYRARQRALSTATTMGDA